MARDLTAVLRGERGYTYDLANIQPHMSYRQIRENVLEKALEVCSAVEEKMAGVISQHITAIKVGKSIVKERINRGINDNFLYDDPMTWEIRNGITRHWHERRQEGYHVLVTIACITEDLIPEYANDQRFFPNPQRMAEALKQFLIPELHRHGLPIANVSVLPKRMAAECVGGLVYIAFQGVDDDEIDRCLHRLFELENEE